MLEKIKYLKPERFSFKLSSCVILAPLCYLVCQAEYRKKEKQMKIQKDLSELPKLSIYGNQRVCMQYQWPVVYIWPHQRGPSAEQHNHSSILRVKQESSGLGRTST